MKKYSVKVNGNVYEVEVEEITGSAPVEAKAEPAPAAPAAAPVPAPEKKSETPAGGIAVKAPMPGTVLKMNVKVGDKVEKNSLVCILEAMKMENEIFSPEAGTVTAINAPQGATVNSGDAIVTLG
ncbi:MAG: acetyl-CoA carboxylase biotin carboxyl carrier protein subunit [Clostridia bacterium]|nr:acetyl-CoA carboxylase biotin carboxyl carrier protein subunit [Clostridia bacterium]